MDGPQAAEQTPQKLSLGEKLGANIAKGKEGRLHTGERISRFFSSMKQKLYGGVDLAFAAPSIAGTLGGEAGSFAKEKAEQVKNSVVEAGTRAWENTLDAKDRMVARVQNAGDRVRERIVDVRDAARIKVLDLSKRAAIWGLANVASPIEGRLQAIYELPAAIREWQADRADVRVEKQQLKAKLAAERGEARVKALQDAIARSQQNTADRVSGIEYRRDAAAARAAELAAKALERRNRSVQNFSKARLAIEALRTT